MPPRPDDPHDPKGLITEAFRIDGITGPECRSIFVDWALAMDGDDMQPAIAALIARHGADQPDHPMLAVLREGQAAKPAARRRGGWQARRRPA